MLIDNTVIAHGITHETAWINTGRKNWGGHTIDTGYAARIPVHSDSDSSETIRSIRYLPGIASLARRGHILLAVSDELEDEKWTQPVGRFSGYGIYDFSIFSDLKFELIRDPFYTMSIGSSYSNQPSLKAQRTQRLESKADSLYRALLPILGPKNSQDAWHITTAEKNNCYCFLTMDFSLIKIIKSQSKNLIIKSLKTRILTPEKFGREFGIPPISPRFYSYHDASFTVEYDANWPDSKRRKRRRKE